MKNIFLILPVIIFLLSGTAQSKFCSNGPLFSGQVIHVARLPEHCQVFVSFTHFRAQEPNQECLIKEDLAGFFGIYVEEEGNDNADTAANQAEEIELHPCQMKLHTTVLGRLGRNRLKQVTFSDLKIL